MSKLELNPKESPLLFSAQSQSDSSNASSYMETVFEKLECPAFHSVNKSVLSLFANGRSTGFCLDSGANSTDLVPVIDGYALKKAIKTSHLGGEWLTKRVLDFFEKGGKFGPNYDYKYTMNELNERVGVFEPRGDVTDNYREFSLMRIAREAKELHFKIKTDKKNEGWYFSFNQLEHLIRGFMDFPMEDK